MNVQNYENQVKSWLSNFNWSENPFTLSISPELIVGYSEEMRSIVRSIAEREKFLLVTGPTGSGKTLTMKWIDSNFPDVLYLSKPPVRPEDFIGIFTDRFGFSIREKIFGRPPSIYNIHDYVNRKVGDGRLILIIDEVHESTVDVLQWIRVFIDQVDRMTMILAGLPNFERVLQEKLETLEKRATVKLGLGSLSRDETRELIRKRIESAGGSGMEPFTESSVSAVYERTGGFPREIIKTCSSMINDAIDKNVYVIDGSMPPSHLSSSYVSAAPRGRDSGYSEQPGKLNLNVLPEKQRQIIDALSKGEMTPKNLADAISGKYKSEDHAVRSMNNILKRLANEGYIAREQRGKTFVYYLTNKVKSLFVEA